MSLSIMNRNCPAVGIRIARSVERVSAPTESASKRTSQTKHVMAQAFSSLFVMASAAISIGAFFYCMRAICLELIGVEAFDLVRSIAGI